MKRFALLLLVVNIPLLVKMNAEKPEVVTAEDVDKVDPHKTNGFAARSWAKVLKLVVFCSVKVDNVRMRMEMQMGICLERREEVISSYCFRRDRVGRAR